MYGCVGFAADDSSNDSIDSSEEDGQGVGNDGDEDILPEDRTESRTL